MDINDIVEEAIKQGIAKRSSRVTQADLAELDRQVCAEFSGARVEYEMACHMPINYTLD